MKKFIALAALALAFVLSFVVFAPRFAPTSAAALDDSPPMSKTQPDKIVLGKDSKSPKWGEMNDPFNHVAHSTDAKYSVDGKAAVGCTECHHTDQPAAGKCGASTKGFDEYKTFERPVCLTTAELAKADSAPVKSCVYCHSQKDATPASGKPIPVVNRSGKDVSLDNEKAYHLNCIECHKQAKAARGDDIKNAPTTCSGCHASKS